jgi:hypothetical protein
MTGRAARIDAQGSPPSEPSPVSDGVDWQARAEAAEARLANLQGRIEGKFEYWDCADGPGARAIAGVLRRLLDAE